MVAVLYQTLCLHREGVASQTKGGGGGALPDKCLPDPLVQEETLVELKHLNQRA